MTTNQPDWLCVAQLGDANPTEHGGLWVFIDKTGRYAPECERLDVPLTGEWEHHVNRFILEPCTYVDGVLSDNPFHPDKSAWFAQTEAERKLRPQDSNHWQVAEFIGQDVNEFVADITSGSVVERAIAWQAIGDYFGYDNLDQYPLTLTHAEAVERYAADRYNVATLRPVSGYAYQFSGENWNTATPDNWDTVLIGQTEIDSAQLAGTTQIDGVACVVFKVSDSLFVSQMVHMVDTVVEVAN